jgi:hypothetical protein
MHFGRGCPAAIGMEVSPANSTVWRALRVVLASDALPCTVVMPRRSSVRAPSKIAITSSWPGSQSMIAGTFMNLPRWLQLAQLR